MATAALISPCLSLSSATQNPTHTAPPSASIPALSSPGLSPSRPTSQLLRRSLPAVEKRTVRRSVVCEAAPVKKADSATKRARQVEKRRVYNKLWKLETKTRMRKIVKGWVK